METENSNENQLPKFGRGDIIGCGISKSGTLFFTKNGSDLGDGIPLISEVTLVYLTCIICRACIREPGRVSIVSGCVPGQPWGRDPRGLQQNMAARHRSGNAGTYWTGEERRTGELVWAVPCLVS